MEEAWRLAGHGVFIVAEVRQRLGDEGFQASQRLGAVQRPAQGCGLWLAQAVHTTALQHCPQPAVIVCRAPVGRLRRSPRPGLAVVVVKVPPPAFGLAVGIQQQPVAAAHVAVEMLHQPLAAPLHQCGQLATCRQKVFAVHHVPGQRLAGSPGLQLGIQPPLVGLLPLHAAGTVVPGQRLQVAGDGLAVAGTLQRYIAHAVAGGTQLARKIAHGRKNRQYFLGVVQHVVGFLAHLHQHIDHLRVHLLEPAVPGVELVAQHQPQGAGWPGGRAGGCSVCHAVPHRRR